MMSSKEIVGSITRAIAHAMPRRLTGMISALVVSFAFLLWTGVSSIASGSNALRTAGVECNRPASESITWVDLSL
jgi:hypothetical protein